MKLLLHKWLCVKSMNLWHKEGVKIMAKIYANLIRKGLKTIDDVPDKLKAAVQAILDGDD